ncbi:hypothetical protein [Paenibacillus sp. 481]|nr:hypothetical protein [Paenibacillus sp. 481]UHA72619.1 hypothetical protein KIK04_18490 [Paenibacillus sp. 481]
MSAKRKPPTLATKPQDTGNKKALYWVGASLLFIIVIVSILLIVSN